jgi:uncharacterized peroxidase-related enzyme
MARLHQTDPAAADAGRAELFAAVKAKFGKVPNGIQILGTSEEALRGYLAFAGSLSGGALRRAEREQVAIAVAAHNGCDYCLAAHTAAAAAFKVDESDRRAAQAFAASGERNAALLRFSRAVIDTRGAVSDADLQAARDAGLTDAELIEVIAEVALNTFTNYLYRAAQPALDFPAIEVERRAA